MRKRPQQQRSRELVKALIDATAKVIQQQGLDNTTTARIAEVAGVSVGSLYQYFGDKDGLIEALMESLADDIGAGLKRLPLLGGRSPSIALQSVPVLLIWQSSTSARPPLFLQVQPAVMALPEMGHPLPAGRASPDATPQALPAARLTATPFTYC